VATILRVRGLRVVNDGLTPALLAAALTAIDGNQALLAQRWGDIHGDT
jgi:hypothetical protein